MTILEHVQAEGEARYQAWWEQAKPLFEAHDRNRFASLPMPEFSAGPWSNLKKPLKKISLALLSSSGIYLPPQPRYDDTNHEGDYTWRQIPVNVDGQALQIAHTHYDHAAAEQDINTVFPLQRVKDLVAEGFLGAVCDPVFTWHGYVINLFRFAATTAQELADAVVREGADAALIVPV